ncbi:hypothetical protein KIM372_06860 [Bombiscardovia nodaiensis]|uniref:ABC transporter permease n=1 Tax=Bombiscardovia nodaiensis TaxID=2932181 RepID=A0ABM8B7Y1_9BIFI|nr:hypothetical protein KIM372_06860 [Bombiscardovia nodaiensis]
MTWKVFTAEVKAILRPWPTIITAVLALGTMFLLSPVMASTMEPSTAQMIEQYGPKATPALISGSERHNASLEQDFQSDLAKLQPQAGKEGVKDYRTARAFTDKIQQQVWQDASVADSPDGKLADQITGLKSYQDLLSGHRIVDNYQGCNRQSLTIRAADRLGLLPRADRQMHYQYLSDLDAGKKSNPPQLPAQAQQRVEELAGQCQAGMGLTRPDDVFDLTQAYLRMAFFVVLLATLGLCAPLLTRNRMCRMRQTQWVTRTGRRVQGIEMASACCVSLLVTLAVYGFSMILWLPKFSAYLDTPVFDGSYLPWFDWTLGTYILVFLLTSIALNMGCALLMVWVSAHCGSYISLLLILVPFVVVAFILEAEWLMVSPFIIGNVVNNLLPVKGIEGYIDLAVLVLGALLCWASAHRIKHQQLATA